MKECRGCKGIGTLDGFHKDPSKKDGRATYCKKCDSLRHSVYRKTVKGKLTLKKNASRYWGTQKGRDACKKYSNSLKGRESSSNRTKKYRKSTNGRVTHSSIQAKYRASKLQASPNWLTSVQISEINCFYDKATNLTNETGILHHVDHIIPLQGENVSGLHVPWNLQVLTEKENCSKNNKY